jgi:hypothetical protein
MRKTYRIKLHLDGDTKARIYRTDGVPTHCASFQTDYFLWERSTKHNSYQGWSGYVSEKVIKESLKSFNPDGLEV